MSTNIMRQIFLDIETTGMNKIGIHYEGHRIIEIGAVEVINRRLTGRNFHVYLKPDRLVDPIALNVHGISDEFLADQQTFADMADELINFIRDSELIIHNVPFDLGFIDYEFSMLKRGIEKTATFCKVTDSLQLARQMFPGKRNSLDALCERYLIDNSKRNLHGALLDAELLAKVFLQMTGGQTSIRFTIEGKQERYEVRNTMQINRMQKSRSTLKIIYASDEEIIAHEQRLNLVQKQGGCCLWRAK